MVGEILAHIDHLDEAIGLESADVVYERPEGP
jgi:hypothetical protein